MSSFLVILLCVPFFTACLLWAYVFFASTHSVILYCKENILNLPKYSSIYFLNKSKLLAKIHKVLKISKKFVINKKADVFIVPKLLQIMLKIISF